MQSFTYDLIERSLPAKFMTTQSTGNILVPFPTNTRNANFCIQNIDINNRSSAVATVGFGGVLPIALWTAGRWDDSEYAAGTVGIDDTADAQSSTANDFAMDTVSVNNDGFYIASSVPFNVASIHVGQASAASTAWALYYSKPTAGTGFSSNYGTISNALVAPSFGSTGERLLWFNHPSDWIKTSSTTAIINRHGLGIPADNYVVLVKSTTAPNSTAGLASLIVVGQMFYGSENIADNNSFTRSFAPGEAQMFGYLESVAVAISDVTNLGSRATVQYRLR